MNNAFNSKAVKEKIPELDKIFEESRIVENKTTRIREQFDKSLAIIKTIYSEFQMNSKNIVHFIEKNNQEALDQITEKISKKLDDLEATQKLIEDHMDSIVVINEQSYHQSLSKNLHFIDYSHELNELRRNDDVLAEHIVDFRKKIDNLKEETMKVINLENEIATTDNNVQTLFCFKKYHEDLNKEIEKNLQKFNESLNKSEEDKKDTLQKLMGNDKIVKFQEELQENSTLLIQKNREMQQGFLNNQKIVMEGISKLEAYKYFHNIFVIDESGSMSSVWEQVINCTRGIIEDRKKDIKKKDKVSIITFDNNAKVHIINKSVSDNIEMPELQGGGTSYIPALEKINDTLNVVTDLDCQLLIFFLSDGIPNEYPTDILNRLSGIYSTHQKKNIIFICVGYGEDVNADLLEDMSKIMNGGNPFIKMGAELIKSYHNCSNEEELFNVYKIFDKIFDSQKSILETQSTLNQQMNKKFNASFQETLNFNKKINQQFLEDKDQVLGLMESQSQNNDYLINEIQKRISTLNEEKKSNSDIINKFNNDISEMKASIKKNEAIKVNEDKTFQQCKQDVEEAEKKLNELKAKIEADYKKNQKQRNEENQKEMEKSATELEVAEVRITDLATAHTNYQEKMKSIRSSTKIRHTISEILDRFSIIRDNFTRLKTLKNDFGEDVLKYTLEHCKNKFSLDFEITDGEGKKKEMDDNHKLIAAVKHTLNTKENDKKNHEALDFVLSDDTALNIVKNLGFENEEKMVDKLIDKLSDEVNTQKDEKKELEKELKKIITEATKIDPNFSIDLESFSEAGTDLSENTEKNNDLTHSIKRLRKDIKTNETEINFFRDHRKNISLIYKKIQALIFSAKQDYIQAEKHKISKIDMENLNKYVLNICQNLHVALK
jgi:uncharacterized protein YegL